MNFHQHLTTQLITLVFPQFDQFSGTLVRAAVEQQESVVNSIDSLAVLFSSVAESTNQTWPNVTIHEFGRMVEIPMIEGGLEIMSFHPEVLPEDREAYIEFMKNNYQQSAAESFRDYRGPYPLNSDFFADEAFPGMLFSFGSDGTLVDDSEREVVTPMWQGYPPITGNILIGHNLAQFDHVAAIYQAGKQLRTEVLYTDIRDYSVFAPELHSQFHSGGPEINHPHVFANRVILRDAWDTESDVVGFVSVGLAWDYALRNLLPSSVKDIMVVIRNTCNQSFTYRIDGADAIFVGDGDLHAGEFDSMRADANLSRSIDDPRVTSVPGHCLYNMVR